MQDRPQFIRCLVTFYAYLDIQQSPFHLENESSDMLRAFSPIAHLPGDASSLVPMFIARAGQDEIPMMNDSIDRFIAATVAANVPLTYMNHPEGEHASITRVTKTENLSLFCQVCLSFLQHHARHQVTHGHERDHECRNLQLVMRQIRQSVRTVPYR
jgi:hypothetical protein